jgi:hypothetical protein
MRIRLAAALWLFACPLFAQANQASRPDMADLPAIVDVGYGPRAIALLRQGISPEQVVKSIWESDPDPRPQDWSKEGRQFAVIDAKGNVYAYTDRSPRRSSS